MFLGGGADQESTIDQHQEWELRICAMLNYLVK